MRIILRAVFGLFGLAATGWMLAEQSSSMGAESASPATVRTPAAVAAEIDRLLEARLAEAKLPVSPSADDAAFLRRATLDLCGCIPTTARLLAFLAQTDPNKRAHAIDELLADPRYGRHFGRIWYHRMVRPDTVNRLLISPLFQNWLANRFNNNQGWDRTVRDILTASGPRDGNPATVFWLGHVGDKKGQPQPSKVAAASARLFLGVKLECAECHNHPFTHLTQEDFWGVAAFFANTHGENSLPKQAKKNMPAIREGAIRNKKGKKGKKTIHVPFGSITIPDSKGKIVSATVLGGKPVVLANRGPLRPLFAEWATSPQNPYFARAAVNKMWANFFGRGLVDPVDDMRPETKATHPEILQLLADEFTASGFDGKHLARCICQTRAYQRASRSLPANRDDDQLYSRMRVKVMSADMLFDSLAVALGHPIGDNKKGKVIKNPRKREGSPRERFRKFFHAEVDDDIGVAENYTHGVPQALQLMNAQSINDTSTAVAESMKTGDTPEAVIEALYLRVLSRRPTATEIGRMKKYLAEDQDQSHAYGDILWALLNSGEFLLNH